MTFHVPMARDLVWGLGCPGQNHTAMGLSAGNELTGRPNNVAISLWAQLGPVGKDPAIKHSPVSPNPGKLSFSRVESDMYLDVMISTIDPLQAHHLDTLEPTILYKKIIFHLLILGVVVFVNLGYILRHNKKVKATHPGCEIKWLNDLPTSHSIIWRLPDYPIQVFWWKLS